MTVHFNKKYFIYRHIRNSLLIILLVDEGFHLQVLEWKNSNRKSSSLIPFADIF